MTEHVNVASRPSDTVTFCSCPMNVGIPPNASTGKRNFVFIFSEKILHMFCSSHFWFLVTFGNEVTKIQKYYVIFVYILQGKMGKTGKNEKENHANKVNKIPKTKRQKYGMNNRPNNINCTVSLSKVVGRGFTQFSINMYGWTLNKESVPRRIPIFI